MSNFNVLEELKRMVDHFEAFANDHSMDATTETWAALYCAKAAIRDFEQKTVAWIETRTIDLDWTEKVIVSNPQYRENNGPDNFSPLYVHYTKRQ